MWCSALPKRPERKGSPWTRIFCKRFSSSKARTVLLASDDTENRRKRAEAGARILEIQKRVKPDPEGWTSRDYINHGRR